MRRIPLSRLSGLIPPALSVALACSPALAADPAKAPQKAETKSEITKVQLQPPTPEVERPEPVSTTPPTQLQPITQTQPVATPAVGQAPAQTLGGTGSESVSQAAASRPNAVQSETASNVVSGGEAQTRNATDVGSLLGRSLSDPGVFTQQRNPIMSDPRIRSYHVGQINTQADGGFWMPARPDLDTVVSKYDASNIQDIIVIKGPYSVHYGPGFSFLDIQTINPPRYQNGTEFHTRSFLGYQTNGQRWDGRETVYGGGSDWGFRIGYGLRTGSDYTAGNGMDIPSSYNSQDVNFALSYDFSPDSHIEFKGLRLSQKNLEFPGLYFDINKLTTDAYSVRYQLLNQDYFDRFTADLWYNRTGAEGNTQQGAKQTFLTEFLSTIPGVSAGTGLPFVPGTFTPTVVDGSSTHFSESSKGYRFATSWGQANQIQLTAGTDLNYVNQMLSENIVIHQIFPPGSIGVPAGVPTVFPGTPPLQVSPGVAIAGAGAAPGVPALPPGTLFQELGIPQSHFVDPGIYLEGALPVNPRLNFKGGARYDAMYTASDPRVIFGNVLLSGGVPGSITTAPTGGLVTAPGASGPTILNPNIYSSKPGDPNTSRNFGLFATYVTGEYFIDEHLTALGGVGYSQRPPTLVELYSNGPFINYLQQGLTRIVGDPHLTPPKLTQMDLGLKGNYGWLRGGVNGFYSWINDYITFNQVSTNTPFNVVPNSLAGTPTGGSNTIVFTNTPRATIGGGELYGQADVTTWLTPFGNLAYVQARDLTHNVNNQPGLVSSRSTISQEPLPGIPPLNSIVGFRVHQPGLLPRWNVEFSTQMTAGQHLVASSLDELSTPGYTLYNIRSYWNVTQAVLLTGGVENIGNKFYRTALDPRSGSPTDVLFQPGRNFYFGIQVTY